MITRTGRWRLVHPALIAWLTLVWLLLWSDVSLANVLAGLAVATTVTVVLHLNPVPFRARLRPLRFASLLAYFAKDLLLASVQVASLALRPGRVPRGAVIRVQLRSHSDVVLTTTAALCSLVPGSIVIEAHRLTGTLYVHIVDAELVGGLDAAREHVLEQEKRVLYALADADVIVEAGLPASPRRHGRSAAPRGGSGAPS